MIRCRENKERHNGGMKERDRGDKGNSIDELGFCSPTFSVQKRTQVVSRGTFSTCILEFNKETLFCDQLVFLEYLLWTHFDVDPEL